MSSTNVRSVFGMRELLSFPVNRQATTQGILRSQSPARPLRRLHNENGSTRIACPYGVPPKIFQRRRLASEMVAHSTKWFRSEATLLKLISSPAFHFSPIERLILECASAAFPRAWLN